TRRIGVGAEDGDRFAALHQERFVWFKRAQRRQDGVKRLPIACRPAPPTVDDEVFGIARHLRVEVVLQHAVGRFDEPVFTGEAGAPRGANGAVHGVLLFSWTVGDVQCCLLYSCLYPAQLYDRHTSPKTYGSRSLIKGVSGEMRRPTIFM